MTRETYKFLVGDFAVLDARIAEYEERLRIARGGIHESTTQSSETWHDNPAFDEAQQQSKMWDAERRRLLAIRAESEIVSAGEGPEVAIGTTVRFKDLDSGRTDEITIGSYMTSTSDEDVIAYAAPLARLLLDRKSDEVVEGLIGKAQRRFQVIAVVPAEAVGLAHSSSPAATTDTARPPGSAEGQDA